MNRGVLVFIRRYSHVKSVLLRKRRLKERKKIRPRMIMMDMPSFASVRVIRSGRPFVFGLSVRVLRVGTTHKWSQLKLNPKVISYT